jgi:hypothetical protein
MSEIRKATNRLQLEYKPINPMHDYPNIPCITSLTRLFGHAKWPFYHEIIRHIRSISRLPLFTLLDVFP